MDDKEYTHLDLIFDERGGKRFFVDAYVKDDGDPIRLNLNSISRKRFFRALCIFLILSKSESEKPNPPPLISFHSGKSTNTWIATLAGKRFDKSDELFTKEFRIRKFLDAPRGNPPYVEYIEGSLPFRHLNFHFGESGKPSVKVDSMKCLEDFAIALEREEPKWTVKTVPWLLGRVPITTESDNAESSVNKASGSQAKPVNDEIKHITGTSRVKDHKDRLAHELYYHIRRDGGQDDAMRLIRQNMFDWQEICNLPLSKYGEPPLLLAVATGKRALSEYLLSLKEIDVNGRSVKGVSAFLKAASMNDGKMMGLLEERKADIHVQNYERGNAIYEAAFGATEKAEPIIKHLISKNVAIGIVCLDGSNAYTVASTRRCPGSVKELVPEVCFSIRAFPKGRECENFIAALYDCFRRGNYKRLSEVFVATGYFPLDQELSKGRNFGELPERKISEFFKAAERGDSDFLKSWLDQNQKCDVNAEEPIAQCMALHVAAEKGHVAVVDALIAANCDPFVQNNHGRVPRELLPVKMTNAHKEVLVRLTKYEQRIVENEYQQLRNAR